MNIEPSSKPIEVQERPVSRPVPPGWLGFFYCTFILIMPMVAFWATDLFLPEWQDGKFGSYIILLLTPKASLIFFPLLAFSVICYILLSVDPIKYSQKNTIRLGIYGGVLLALQFSIVSALYFFDTNPSSLLLIIGWLLPLIISRVYPWAAGKWGTVKVITVITVVVVAAVILLMVFGSPSAPILLILAGLTIVSPFWCFLISLRAALWLLKNAETGITLQHGLGLTTWLATYAFAWRYGILKMYELYAALPPQPPPDCYIATAAAQGHSRFVGSKVVYAPDGSSMQVNRQLQILKCAEVALMATSPRFHIVLRRAYDLFGKPLARRMRNPFLADCAYLVLKPWEWLAHLILKIIVPEIDLISRKMYVNR